MQDTLYGNEWIDFENPERYFKIKVAEDGLYRIPQSVLPAEAASVEANQFRLFCFGEEVPLRTSSTGLLSDSDYLQFYGEKNRQGLNAYLFSEGQIPLNPDYNLFTDTAVYFLTWGTENGLRYEELDNDLSNTPAPESTFTYTEKQVETTDFNKSKLKAGNVSLERSYFDMGEGFGKRFTSNSDYTHTFSLEGLAPGSDATLSLRYAGSNNINHEQSILINDEEAASNSFFNYVLDIFTLEIPNAEENTEVKIDALPGTGANGQSTASILTIGSASVTYERLFDFGGASEFRFTLNGGGEKYLEIENFDFSSEVYLFDLTNNLRIPCLIEDNLVKVYLPSVSSQNRDLLLLNEESVFNSVSAVEQVTFTDFSENDTEFYLLSNPALYFDNAGVNQMEAYKDYRNETLRTEIVDIQQLYNQFCYGVQRNPLSVRNFVHYIHKNNDAAKYFFLVGNSREYNEVRTAENLASAEYYLPTFGSPGGDNLMFSYPDQGAPLYPIGRLTAKSGEEVKAYLEKVIGADESLSNNQTIEERLWMKDLLHLGGGGTDFEQISIRSGLESMESTIANGLFGGRVTSFYKTSTDVIEESPRDVIEGLVNNGVSIINFFGHSGQNSFDFPIQNPDEYNNTDRYFLLISNGCFSGRCHLDQNGIGERFVFEPQKGAIAYYASNGYGYISALNTFTRDFYDKLGGELYGKSLGEIFQKTVIDRNGNFNNSSYGGINLLTQQMTFQGDPLVTLFPGETPDLVFDEESLRTEPDLLNTQLDSFTVAVDLVNLGKNIPDTMLNVKVEFAYPDGNTAWSELIRTPLPPNREQLSFNIPIFDTDSIVGLNTIYMNADETDEIDEQPGTAEVNNELLRSNGERGVQVLIVSNDAVPVFPKNYSIVGDQNLELIASTVDVFAERQNFVLQIDTTMQFNSPAFKETVINQSGGLLKWTPEVGFADEVVYYWRCSPEPENGAFRWSGASFLFSENYESGWNQSHYFQYLNNDYSFTQIEENRKFNYVRDFKEILIETGVVQIGQEFIRPCIYINNQDQNCGYSQISQHRGIRIYAFDFVTLEPKTHPFILSDLGTPRKHFEFNTTTPEGRKEAMDFLTDSIPDGDYVGILTLQRFEGYDYEPEEWASDTELYGTNLFDILEAEGADIVRDLEFLGSRPYTFFYRKGYPDEIGGEVMRPPVSGAEGTASAVYNASANYEEGKVISLPIGPATAWNSLAWSMEETPEPDEVSHLTVYGIKATGEQDTLFAEVTAPETDLSSVSADTYPNLKLEWFSRDSIARTSPQLQNWRVVYEGVPEAALNPQIGFAVTGDTIAQGQRFNLAIGVENISPYDMDSLQVDYLLKDINNQSLTLNQRNAPLIAGDSTILEVSFDTKDIRERASLLVDVNPDFAQPEETRINNTGLLNFFVQPDQRNPILDVTFDGVHILNGDIISPTPQIVMSFSDENEFLAMSDTSQFRLSVDFPDRSSRRVYFSDPQIVFIPADPSNLDKENKAVIEYAPEFEQDGTYTLRVEGQDASGNASGELQYTIEFEIITKSMISNVLNYPNPFSNATRFVYTLTGEESPAFFKIQIMTVSGRIVREITQTELGEMKIGTHQTDFVWDGTDEYGDKLANGVYLYRVVAKNAAGEDIEQYETDADRFFNKGFGKMVIVR